MLIDELREIQNSNNFITAEDVKTGLDGIDRAEIDEVIKDRARNNYTTVDIVFVDNSIQTSHIDTKNFKIKLSAICGDKKTNDTSSMQIFTGLYEWFKEQYEAEGLKVDKIYKEELSLYGTAYRITISWEE